MGFSCGIIGLPNVGKSTLFNALTQKNIAQAENYPFCTIKPNIAEVIVPDERLQKISLISQSQQQIPARVGFTDIAGLIKGAAQGEGLGNQFLAHIRNVQAIFHVVRCYHDDDIEHVNQGNRKQLDPISDAEIINTELMLADMQSLEKQIQNLKKKVTQKDGEVKLTLEAAILAYEHLQKGRMVKSCPRSQKLQKAFKNLQLLTDKYIIYLANVDEKAIKNGNELSKKIQQYAEEQNTISIHIAAKTEADLGELGSKDYQDYLKTYDIKQSALVKVIKSGYNLLDLITYFTSGVKESRAWAIAKDSTAPQAAGKIHSDFESGFIRAEVIAYQDYIEHNGEAVAKKAGKMRLEGKDYIVKDGDIVHFRFAV